MQAKTKKPRARYFTVARPWLFYAPSMKVPTWIQKAHASALHP